MLDWIRRRFGRPELRGSTAPRGTPAVRVTFDRETITVEPVKGPSARLAWAEIGRVMIVTSDGGPFVDDLFWVLQGRDPRRTLMLPMGAEGEHDLLHAMQERLPGFDNMAVVEAMGEADSASFLVWDCERKPEAAD